jgi:uncharacterized membrane protein YhhN
MASIGKYTLLQIALGIAVFNWLAVSVRWKWLEYLTKPAVMIAMIAGVFRLRPGLVAQGQVNWLALALIFSLVGDIFLMLPGDRFIPGLAAFLLAHVAYIINFSVGGGFSINPATLILAALVAATSLQLYRRIAAGLTRKGQHKLKLPVLAYTIVISTMTLIALNTLTTPAWENYRALMIGAGALLFMLSDTWIAWDRFVEPLRWRDLRVMMTYHLGQLLLVLGAVYSP